MVFKSNSFRYMFDFNFKNFLVWCFFISIFLGTRVRCDSGSGSPPPISTSSFFIEVDKMINSDYGSLDDIFTDAFKNARTGASVCWYFSEASIENIETLDERDGDVTTFIYLHRDTLGLGYDGRCYIAGVRYVIDDFGTTVSGLAIWVSDTSFHDEGGCVVAVQQIADDFWNLNPVPTEWTQYDKNAQASAHEIGHMFCLNHCDSTNCIMQGNLNVATAPIKRYCRTCSTGLSSTWP